jgi:hypothetical protein
MNLPEPSPTPPGKPHEHIDPSDYIPLTEFLEMAEEIIEE